MRKLLAVALLLLPAYAQAAVPVVWTAAVGVTDDGEGTLTKTATNGWGNGGAISTQQIIGNGYVEFTAIQTSVARLIGLSNGDTNQDYSDIDFAVELLNDATVAVYEGGTSKGAYGTYAQGDVFRVGVTNGVVRYYKNGTAFYVSSGTPTFPLIVDSAIFNQGGKLANAMVQADGGVAFPKRNVEELTSGVSRLFGQNGRRVRDASLAAGLLDYWALDEKSGPRYGTTGRLSPLPIYTASDVRGTGVLGASGFGDGTNSAYLRNTDVTGLEGATYATVAGWVKRYTPVESYACVAGPYRDAQVSLAPCFRASDNQTYAYSTSNSGTLCTTPTSPADGQWHHYVTVWDGTQANQVQRMRIYLDGSELTGYSNGPLTPNPAILSIGPELGIFINGTGGGNGGSKNQVDEVGVWVGRALSATEVMKLYNGGVGYRP